MGCTKFNETNHTDLKPDIIINTRMEMTGDISQEAAESFLLTEEGHQILTRPDDQSLNISSIRE